MLRRLSIPLFALLQAAVAQQKPAPYTFQANTRLVVETVTVTGADGKPVAGLTARDFTITENGRPQSIAFCDFQKIQNAAQNQSRPRAAAAPSPSGLPPLTTFGIAPETPGNTRYTGRRLVALYFDMVSMPQSDQLRALNAAQRFIAADLEPADRVAIMSYQGAGVRVEQDFTHDRDALDAALEKISLGSGQGFAASPEDAASPGEDTAFGQDYSSFNLFSDNRELAALQTAVEMLAPISEKKSLVLFASGLNLHEVDNEAQLEATEDAAIRSNVNLFPVDARGLVASAPLGNATQASPGGAAMYSGAAFLAFSSRLQQSQDTLYALGADTGGKALLNSNNLVAGIVRARNAIASYYILGYYTSNAALDGKFRHVKISLTGHRRARLDYRGGYYAGKVFAKFTSADKERQLEDALMLGDPITDLNLALRINYFQMNPDEYFVPMTALIPGRELVLAKKGGAEQALIDFIGEVKDAYGLTLTNLRDQVRLKLSGATAAQLAQTPIAYNTGFTLLPGTYSIKVLARDDETGRIGTYMTNFTIPNLARVAHRLPISSVVLGNERIPIGAMAFNVQADGGNTEYQAPNPLVQNGVELIPSVTRTFSKASRLFVYFQTYIKPRDHSAASGPLFAYVSFYRDRSETWESPLQEINSMPQGPSGTVGVNLTVMLDNLTPGRYTCQVTVLDPGTQKANFWRGAVEITP